MRVSVTESKAILNLPFGTGRYRSRQLRLGRPLGFRIFPTEGTNSPRLVARIVSLVRRDKTNMTDLSKINDGGRSGDGENSHKTLEEGVASKILRETQMVGIGVGGAFLDTAKNPIQKAPELAMAGGFGVGLKTLQNAGAKGRAVASVVGLGMAGKMAYDEYMGDRWSTFGSALKDNWQSPENFERNLIATKRSVGALAVDSTVATIGFKAAGSQIGNRLLKGEMGSKVPLRVVLDEPRFSWPKSAEGLRSTTPRSPALLTGIRDAAKGKQINDHVTPSGQVVSGDFNLPSPLIGSAEGLLSYTLRSDLILKDSFHAGRHKLTADPAGHYGAQAHGDHSFKNSLHAEPPRKPSSPKEVGAAGKVEIPAGNLSSLDRFSLEMYQGIRSRINASSGAEHSGLVGGRAHGGHSSSSLLRGMKDSGPKVEAPVNSVKPLEAPTGKSSTNPMEMPSDSSSSLSRFSDEVYEGISQQIKGSPKVEASLSGAHNDLFNAALVKPMDARTHLTPGSEPVNIFQTSYPTVIKPLQNADAVVSLTSQGTVGSVSLSTGLLTSPVGVSKVQSMLGFAELAATDPAACDAALASTLLGRVGLAGRATNTKAALKGAEAYVNGARGNSYTSFLLDRYGKL